MSAHLKGCKAVLSSWVKLLSSGVDVHDSGVLGNAGKQVLVEEVVMQALQATPHMCRAVALCQALQSGLILQDT